MLLMPSRARGLLDGIPRRGPAAAGYRAACERAPADGDALAGYAGMLARGFRPDAYTFPPLLKAVARRGGPAAAAPAAEASAQESEESSATAAAPAESAASEE